MPDVIDSSSLINANRTDFPPAGGHPFWNWLAVLGRRGQLIIPESVYVEVARGDDPLRIWLCSNKSTFFAPTASAAQCLPQVLAAYGADPSETELERMQADPFVIAHAMACGGRVISNEAPRPEARTARNKKIPSICATLGIECWSLSRLLWEKADTLPGCGGLRPQQ